MRRGEQAEALDRLNARDAGKPEVHQHDVGAQIEDDLDSIVGVGCLADEIETAG